MCKWFLAEVVGNTVTVAKYLFGYKLNLQTNWTQEDHQSQWDLTVYDDYYYSCFSTFIAFFISGIRHWMQRQLLSQHGCWAFSFLSLYYGKWIPIPSYPIFLSLLKADLGVNFYFFLSLAALYYWGYFNASFVISRTSSESLKLIHSEFWMYFCKEELF